MKTRAKFKLNEGENIISQGNNELHIIEDGARTYIWIGGECCYATLSGMKTLETLAASIYKALGYKPMWTVEKPKRKK